MQNEMLNILLLLAGLLLVFIAVMPLISRQYFDEINNKFWRSKGNVIPEKDAYIYNRYVRQIGPLITGLLLLLYVFYRLHQ